ncbi:hypothetical protein H0E87_021958, partial [Populus deltoides]
IEAGGNPGVIFKTHPNMNKELFANENILGLRDPSRPFPTGQTGDAGVGLLKWRMQRADESMVPLTSGYKSEAAAHLSTSIAGHLFLEMKHLSASSMKLHLCLIYDVVISVPLPALREPPSVRQIDGEWR